MDVSTENVDVFSRHRHGVMELAAAVALVQRDVKSGPFKRGSALNETFPLKDKIVLDAGCGGGLKSAKLAHFQPRRVIGVDGSAPAIEAAAALARELGLDNTTFLQGRLEALPELLAEAGFPKVDLIINPQVIHHTSNWRDILRAFSEVLNDDGILLVSWLNAGINWGSYMWKNRIAFSLGNDMDSRLRIGKAMFGWWDKRYNRQSVEWDSFFADRYSAYYATIFVGQMLRELHSLGFVVEESYPPVDAAEWARRAPPSPRNVHLKRLVDRSRGIDPILTFGLRLKQFVGKGGGERVLYCRKPGAARSH